MIEDRKLPGEPRGLGHAARIKIQNIFKYFTMSVLALFFIFPIIFMLVTSVKNSEMQILSDVSTLKAFIPYGDLGFRNFTDVFARMKFGRLLANSTLIMLVTVLAGLLVNSLIAYSLARIPFKGRKIVLSFVIALLVVPFQSVAVPLLMLVNKLPWFGGATSWLDTYHVQIIPFIADAFSVFLFYQFFISFPKELEEAALIDGANLLRIYWSIILPLSRPVFATVAILQALASWNRFMWPLMVTRGVEVRPLTVGMQTFFGQDPRLWGDLLAFASMITLPVLIVFLIFQKWFVQSVASTGIKG